LPISPGSAPHYRYRPPDDGPSRSGFTDTFRGGFPIFYDAISPIVDGASIDYTCGFWASRYDEGGDYFNLPLTEEEYDTFWQALTTAHEVPLHPFEEPKFFEGCLPIEVMARRGKDTLRYGPMKPVGLSDPRTGCRPYAVLQLRRENQEGTMFNLVGFQTKLRWPEQRRVFSLIPGLEKAEYVRYGSMHRNTYVHGPKVLTPSLALQGEAEIFLAGQITGVEGYIESAAMGLLAGISIACLLQGVPFSPPPPTTALGALLRHITTPTSHAFQPMNVNFGLFPPLGMKVPARERGQKYAARAQAALGEWKRELPPHLL